MKRYFTILRGLLAVALVSQAITACTVRKEEPATASNSIIDQKVDSVFQLMNLTEKIGQLNQYSVGTEMTGPTQSNNRDQQRYNDLINGKVGSVLNLVGAKNTRLLQEQVLQNSRLKIPLIFAYDVIHGYKTMFPLPLAESCSWNLELMEKTAAAAAAESAASGLQWTFAPMVDVSRDARWGRVMEGAGEDPFLGGEIAVARIKGFQGNNLADSLTIAACAKHFAGYGFVESGKDYNTVSVGTNTLMNAIIPPFRKSAEAGAATFMNAFNDIDGTPSTANSFLLRTLLKGEWNYNGVVVSDWNSIGEMVNHRTAKDLKHAAEQAITAGSDIDMEAEAYTKHLEELVASNPKIEDFINDAVKRVLRLKFELGLFDDPYKYCNEATEAAVVGNKAFEDLAQTIAEESIVLLKNDKNTLPISPEKAGSIAVIGPLAKDKDAPLGNWRAKAVSNSAISLFEGLEAVYGSNLLYAEGCKLSVGPNNFFEEQHINTTDKSGFAEAISVAKKADKVIMVLGETAYQSGEGRSRADIGLPGVQLDLLKEIQKVNPNIVLVVMSGRPLELTWADQNIPAIVEAWHCGQRAGAAIANILSGKVNPSGKLTMSFPRHVGQMPLYYNHKTTGRPSTGPNQVFYTHHGDVDNSALYPFGFGLSYTQFEYSNFKLSSTSVSSADTLIAEVTVSNVGSTQGKETVQLYLTDKVASVTLPELELKGFEKITLAPQESKTVQFKIHKELLSFYNLNNEFTAEAGEFDVHVGPNSSDLQTLSFELK